MFNVAQKIILNYDGRQLWINVFRYNTPTELQTALSKSAARDFDAKTVVYTELFEKGPECGRMHLLDTSIETLAREAAKMAFHIGQRENVIHALDYVADWEEVISRLIGTITSELYSKNKHF